MILRVLLQRFERKPRRIEELPPHLRRLAERYRRAVADVLGVPPEAIRDDVVVEWVTRWAEAYLKPEWRHRVMEQLRTQAFEWDEYRYISYIID